MSKHVADVVRKRFRKAMNELETFREARDHAMADVMYNESRIAELEAETRELSSWLYANDKPTMEDAAVT